MVVANTRDKRDGKALDIIGFYNPSLKPAQFKYDDKKLAEWQTKGALISNAVQNLIDGKYTYTKYKGKKAGEEKSA